MIEFEKIGDTFEEGFDKVKDFSKKNKIFTFAILGVGGYALYKLFSSKYSSNDTEYVSTYAYVPTAYDGYPTMSESVSYDDVVNQLRTETKEMQDDFYSETMSDIAQLIEKNQLQNDNQFDEIIESMSKYDEDLTTMSYLEEQRQKQQILDRMKSNSEAWHNASPEEQERLHQENVVLGSILGADFDSASGTWSQDGQSLYNVPIKNKTNSSTSELTNVGVKTTGTSSGKSTTTTKTNNSDVISQMKANSEAWHSASATERKELEAKNQALGKSLGADFDSASGTWSKNGTKLY